MQDTSLAGVPSASDAPPHLLGETGLKAEIALRASAMKRLALPRWRFGRLGARARAPPELHGAR